jgi:hypothetical protein
VKKTYAASSFQNFSAKANLKVGQIILYTDVITQTVAIKHVSTFFNKVEIPYVVQGLSTLLTNVDTRFLIITAASSTIKI